MCKCFFRSVFVFFSEFLTCCFLFLLLIGERSGCCCWLVSAGIASPFWVEWCLFLSPSPGCNPDSRYVWAVERFFDSVGNTEPFDFSSFGGQNFLPFRIVLLLSGLSPLRVFGFFFFLSFFFFSLFFPLFFFWRPFQFWQSLPGGFQPRFFCLGPLLGKLDSIGVNFSEGF